MTVDANPYVSLEEYFDFEYKAEFRHEYEDGKVRDVSYKSVSHGTINGNISRLIGNCLYDTESEIFATSRMLFIPTFECVYYPDVLVILDEHRFHYYKQIAATINPDIIIEVICEDYDMTHRWQRYQTIPSLKQYILISQKSIFVELYEKQEGNAGAWIYKSYRNLNDTLQITGCNIMLKDIYNKVEFSQVETP